ncbi:MAG: hypothetical protein PUA90_01435 [bacterium]|nr:hypothetical protein [bacterium]
MNTNENNAYLFVEMNRFSDSKDMYPIDNLNENEILAFSKTEMIYSLNEFVKTIIFNCGMDEYIQRIKSFNSSMYKQIITKYKSLFDNGEYDTSLVKESAYRYIMYVLSKSNIYKATLKDYCIYNVTPVNNDVYLSIASIIKNVDLERYKYLKDFIEYLDMNMDINIKTMK